MISLKDLSRRHHDLLIRGVSCIEPGTTGLHCAAALSDFLEETRDGISLIRLDINRNQTVCHAQPDNTPFTEGDIITVDLVLERAGLFSDASWSLICGEDIMGYRDLLEAAWTCARQAVLSAVPGTTSLKMKKDLHEILRNTDMALLEEACGHGIGREVHMLPDISYDLKNRNDISWRQGMVFTAEPVITRGECPMIQDGSENWITGNKEPSAYFEHMCLIEGSGVSCLNIPEINDINCIDIF